MMMPSDRVYITTDVTRRANVYHTDRDCVNAQNSTMTEIARITARNHNVSICKRCSGEADLNDNQQRLYKMDPDDVPALGGGKA